MYTRNLNSVRYRNLLLRDNGTLDHGHGQVRPVYKIDATLAQQYTNLILLSSNNLGYSYNLTATLAKDFGHGLDASIAYTFGEAKAGNDGTSSQAASNWATTTQTISTARSCLTPTSICVTASSVSSTTA